MHKFFAFFTFLATSIMATTTAQEPSYATDTCNEWSPSYFASLSLLRWKPCPSGQDYAMREAASAAPTSVFIDHDADTGYRATLGASLCGLWGASLEYTDYSTEGSHSGMGEYLLTMLPITSTGIFGTSSLDYKVLDFTLGYCFSVSPNFDITTYGGLRSLRFDQKLLIRDGVGDVKLDWDSELKGLGITGGLHGHWKMCGPWALYGIVSASLLKGENDAKYRYQSGGGELYSTKESECLGVIGSHVGVGVNYNTCLWGLLLDLSLGYEAQYWNNTPVMRRIGLGGTSTSATGGNLLLYGWEFRVDACF